jgi:hypothetical protein
MNVNPDNMTVKVKSRILGCVAFCIIDRDATSYLQVGRTSSPRYSAMAVRCGLTSLERRRKIAMLLIEELAQTNPVAYINSMLTLPLM